MVTLVTKQKILDKLYLFLRQLGMNLFQIPLQTLVSDVGTSTLGNRRVKQCKYNPILKGFCKFKVDIPINARVIAVQSSEHVCEKCCYDHVREQSLSMTKRGMEGI